MPVITVSVSELQRFVGAPLDERTLLERLPLLGCDVDHLRGDELAVEFFPNRPDCYSVEGIARALRAFLGLKPGLAALPLAAGPTELRVHRSVLPVRPEILGGIVRGVSLDEPTILSLIGLQEKLDLTLGRQRAKVSIGLHDLDTLTPPFEYKAVARDFIFAPLPPEGPTGVAVEQEVARILADHPKGKQYAHLLPGRGAVPILLDHRRTVLSMPPIINGITSALTHRTRNLFLDVTGTDHGAVSTALAVLMAMLHDRGGGLESLSVVRPGLTPADPEVRLTSPDLQPRNSTLSVAETNALLGLSLSASEVCRCLGAMGHEAVVPQTEPTMVHVRTAAYRADFLHQVDWIEEVAIGHGFDRFPGSLPRAVTFGRPLVVRRAEGRARTAALAMGFVETVTFTLTNTREHYELLGQPAQGPTTIANPNSAEQTMLRSSLIPGLLGQLRLNKHQELPQRLFEVGDVVVDHGNRRHLAVVWTAPKVGFTDIKGVAQRLLLDLSVSVELVPRQHGGFIDGRVAHLLTAAHDEVGYLGELHPSTLEGFELANPAVALELVLEGVVEPFGIGAGAPQDPAQQP